MMIKNLSGDWNSGWMDGAYWMETFGFKIEIVVEVE